MTMEFVTAAAYYAGIIIDIHNRPTAPAVAPGAFSFVTPHTKSPENLYPIN
jgi:hypothetical protein